ncbi:hypothetical protein ABZR52_19260, partial [Pseudomonas aeruginosa]
TPASGEPRRGLRSAAAVELLTSFCLCFLKKPVRQDGVYGAVTGRMRLGRKPGFSDCRTTCRISGAESIFG